MKKATQQSLENLNDPYLSRYIVIFLTKKQNFCAVLLHQYTTKHASVLGRCCKQGS